VTFPIEHIPDDDKLFRRLMPGQCKKGKISSAAFEDVDLSVDWEKYSTPQEALDRLPPHFDKQNWKVASLKAGIPRVLGQEVKHWPTNNIAHSLILGEKSFQISLALSDASEIVK